MIGKTIALIQIPNQRLFQVGPASRYLGITDETLKKLTALGVIKAYEILSRRVYRLEDLDSLIEHLPQWNDGPGEKPAPVISIQERRIQ